MNLPAYPKYKKSGVEWLGDVPEHWSFERLRFSVMSNPVKSEVSNWNDDTLVSFIPMEAVGEYGGIDLSNEKVIGDVYGGYTYFANGDIVIAKITPCFENGKGTIANDLTNGVAFGTTEFHVVRPLKSISQRWLFYLTISHSFRKVGASEMVGAGGQKRVPETYIKDFRTGIPTPAEQQKIADFLDWETGQIDALIAKKKLLIEKLKEKRIALITHAVTKGLNPNAKMKDSGIPWLGEVPEHWEVIPIKFALSMPITDGPHETPEILSEGVPFLSAEAVKNDCLDFNRKRGFISQEDHDRFSLKYFPQRGDVYMVKSGATTGNVARVETNKVFNIWSPLAALRPMKKRSITDFIFYFMKSKPFFYSVELGWSYGTQQNIGMRIIENLKMALPPLDEQKEIASMIEVSTKQIDALITKNQQLIKKLTEYRTALITAATTGKVDVREVEIKKGAN